MLREVVRQRLIIIVNVLSLLDCLSWTRKDTSILSIRIPLPIPPDIDNTFSVNVVIEYEYIKKVVWIALPIFILLTSASFVEHNIRIHALLLLTEYSVASSILPATISIYEILSSLWAALFFVVSGVLLRMLFWLGRKEFRYYFARGCAKKSQFEYGIRQVRYLVLALDSYNRYLQRYLGIQINDKAYSQVALRILADKSELKSLSLCFESADELYPAEYLSQSQKINLPPEEPFLIKGKQTIQRTIIEWSAVAAAVIPLLVTIMKEFVLS